MERYSEYKDSGVQWIGKIPSHWDIIKAKYMWDEVFSFSLIPQHYNLTLFISS